MIISLHPVTEHDVKELAADMLPADRLEVLGLGLDPEDALRMSVDLAAECVVVRGDGQLGSIVGVQDLGLSGDAMPWMLSTSRILCQPKEVLKTSKLIYSRWFQMYPYMYNYVDARHTRAIHWLGWLGARFTLVPEHGPYKRPYYLFEFGEHPCA